MPHNEEGEFELVLGNKQLLSVFFLVVLLLGVFFSMGYIVGRNTAPTATTVATSKPPLVVDSTGSSPAPPPPVPTTTAAITKPPVDKPSALDPKPEPVKPEPAKPAKPEPVKPEPVKTAAVKPEPVKPEPAKPAKPEPVKTASVKPEPAKPAKPEPAKPAKPEPVKAAPAAGGKLAGTYYQVVATKSADAAGVIAKLSAKGFSATTQPVPDSALVRVLVGPVDAASMGKTKSGLEAAGYKPMARKF